MDLGDKFYKKEDYVETSSGNKVCRTTLLSASHNIILQGKVIIQKDAIIRADLAHVRVGRYSILSEGCVLRPPWKKFSKGIAFFPLHMGEYNFIGEESVLQAASVGSHVYIGKNVVVGRRTVIKDCCMIADNSVVPPDTVLSSFCRYGGSPALVVDQLPECMQDLMVDFCKGYYEHFIPNLEVEVVVPLGSPLATPEKELLVSQGPS